MAIKRDLVEENPGRDELRRDLACGYEQCGLVAKDRQAWAEARDFFREDLAIADRLVAEGAAVETRSLLLDCLRPLAECLRKLGEEAEAAACERRIADIEALP